MSQAFTMLLTAAPEVQSKIIEFSWPTIWEMGLQMVAILLLIFVLAKLLFKPVTEFMEKRREIIASDVNHAEKLKSEAAVLKADYEKKLAHIEDEANEILKAARAKALANEEEIIVAARAEAEAIKNRVLQEMTLEQERVKAQMKDEMIEVANLMASKFVASAINEDKQHQLIDEMIKEMGDVQWLS